MKAWRESASAIIAVRNGLKYNPMQPYDYDLLFLKRQKAAKFSGTYVFPGGVIESVDADLKWQNLYVNHGFDKKCFESLFPNAKNRPEIFHGKKNELPREISLRISAIRETFEECGILLCGQSFEAVNKINYFAISSSDLEFWQKKVHHDPNEFYNMCSKLQCYPNLWALHEWANWLTPASLPSAHRFNTAFFFSCLPQVPRLKLDLDEMQELVWATPEYAKKTIINFFLPPQQYEIAKIANHKSLDNLLEYALDKSKNGVQLYFPVEANLSDGKVLLYPGDSMYPDNVNLYKNEILDNSNMTIRQFRDATAVVDRFEISEEAKKLWLMNSKL